MKKSYILLLAVLLLTSGCAVSSVHQGGLDNGVFRPSTQKFSMNVPESAKVFDGTHALGEYVIVHRLPKPLEVRGVSSVRVANVDEATSEEAKENIIKSGYEFWKKGYADSGFNIISSEWIELAGKPAYFTVLEGQSAGLLVKPNSFYGTLSFLRDGYSYVVFEKIRTDKKLIGSEGRPAGAGADLRKKSILAFYNGITFQ